MSGLPTQHNSLTNESLINESARLLLEVLGSCDRDKIDPKKYWDHAQKALQIGADRGTTYQRMVSEMHGQLPISGAFRAKTSRAVYLIGETLKQQGTYSEFRQVCRLNAPYIVVLARVMKEEAKKNTAPGTSWDIEENEDDAE